MSARASARAFACDSSRARDRVHGFARVLACACFSLALTLACSRARTRPPSIARVRGHFLCARARTRLCVHPLTAERRCLCRRQGQLRSGDEVLRPQGRGVRGGEGHPQQEALPPSGHGRGGAAAALLNRRVLRGVTRYLVRWRGPGPALGTGTTGDTVRGSLFFQIPGDGDSLSGQSPGTGIAT